MESNNKVRVTNVKHAGELLRELTIAWAHDAATSRPIHILELDSSRSGARSGCICPACGAPMVAVNNAKDVFVKRPHFRHHAGTGHHDCAIVAARSAILRSMEDLGWLDLPAREVGAKLLGLDGRVYEAFSSRPAHRVHIRSIDLVDRTHAVLSLADGREINVILTGAPDLTASADEGRALITIEVDDPAIAELSPEMLRERLKLNSTACWRKHWDDDDLALNAASQAREIAAEHLAVAPEELQLPEDMPAALKSETVLHYAVKLILQEAGQLRAPGGEILAEAESSRRMHRRNWVLEEQLLDLSNIELEKRLGLTRPDLICTAMHGDGSLAYSNLCVEVTVTNSIDTQRRARIREVGLPAVEIDLRHLAGRVTKSTLRELVVHDTVIKSWLYHPELSQRAEQLDAEVKLARDAEEQAIQDEEAEREEVQATPIEAIAKDYLAAVRTYFEILGAHPDTFVRTDEIRNEAAAARAAVSEAARLLSMRGFHGADSDDLLNSRSVLLNLLSLQLDRPLCRDVNSGFQVLNALMSGGRGTDHAESPLYLGAAKAFRISMTESQATVFETWALRVKARLLGVPRSYERDECCDRLLALLFPELLSVLQKTTAAHHRSLQRRHHRPLAAEKSIHRPAGSVIVEVGPKAPAWLRSPGDDGMRLGGEKLESWVRENPEAAAKLDIRLIPRG